MSLDLEYGTNFFETFRNRTSLFLQPPSDTMTSRGVQRDGGVPTVGEELVKPDLVQRVGPQVPHNLGNDGRDGLLAIRRLARERCERHEEAEEERAAAAEQAGR